MAASAYCPWTPSYALRREKEPKVIKAQYGDGYAQRVGIGINNAPATFSLHFEARTGAEIRDMEAFFASLGGVTPFFVTLPGESWAVSGAAFGVGDGTRTQFQLQRTALTTRQVDLWSGDTTVYTTPRTNYCKQNTAMATTPWASVNGGTGAAATATNAAGIAPDGTATASRIQANRGAGNTAADFSIWTQPAMVTGDGVTGYCQPIWLKSNTGADQVVYLGTNGVGGVVTVTSTWQRLWRTVTPASGVSVRFDVGSHGSYPTGTSSVDILAWCGHFEPGSTPTRAIFTTTVAVTATPAYWPSTGDGFAPVLALDPATPLQIWRNDWQGNQLMYPTARTNYQLYSQAIGSWVVSGGSAVSNVVTSPDGTVDAGNLTEDVSAGLHYIGRAGATLADNTNYCASFWVKRFSGARNLLFYLYDKGAVQRGATFDLGTLTVASLIGVTSAGVIIYPSGWCRVWFVFNSGTGANVPALTAMMLNGSTSSYTGDGTSALSFFGAQVEPGNAPTSYIPTTTAAVTVTDYTVNSSGLVTFAVPPVAAAVMTFTAAGPERHQLVATKWGRGWDGPGRNSLQVDVVEDFS